MSSFLQPIPRRFNRDGSRNIFCNKCGRLCGTLGQNMNFGSVTCTVCYCEANGIELSPDMLEQLNSIRMPNVGLVVPRSTIDITKKRAEADQQDPMSNKLEERLGPKYWFKAVGLKVKQTVQQIVETASNPSQKLANAKKRRRIFDRALEEQIKDEE